MASDLSVRLEVSGSDEFAALAASFNRMAEDLERNRNELEAARTRLEQLVESRTAELKDANERLLRTDHVRRRFLADISHELRTPLTIIRGESEVALRGTAKSNVEYELALKRILEQATHTSALVEDLLFMARRETGDTRMKEQAIAIVDLVRQIVDEVAVVGAEKEIGIEFQTWIEEGTVVGDASRLRQLFMILLDNAMRYSTPRSKVGVAMVQGPGSIVVHVTDTGIGISADELPRVFERYYRGENAANHDGRGTGLGLPLAKVIVEAHGGTIGLTSEIDRGTTATVSLPSARRVRSVK